MPELLSFKHGGNLREFTGQCGLAEDEILDFSANINPLGPPDYLRRLISANLHRIARYPDPGYADFRRAAAVCCAVNPRQIIIGNGTSEIIYALPRALEMRRGWLPAPSYIGYEEALRAAAVPVKFLSAAADLSFNWRELPDMEAAEAIFLGNPNNPTGYLLDLTALRTAARQYSGVMFIIDEAFIDFSGQRLSAIPLIDEGLANIIVLRSMTKFYAIPGLRLGYAVAAETVAAAIERQLPPWRLNTLAAIVGQEIINDEEYGNNSRAQVTKLRHTLQRGLAALPGLQVFPGTANYLLLRVTSDKVTARQIAEHLLAQGIVLRRCNNFRGLDDSFLRLAVRTAPENERLLVALQALLRPAAVPGFLGRKNARTPALMLQGTCSDAGKSIVTAAFGRILLQDGVRTAPFKSQNMSLNSFVTRDGGEMGRAQVVQAQACRLEPDVRMNPILLKPSSQVGSQVIVNGRAVGNMSVDEYIAYKPQAFSIAKTAYDSLAAENQVMLLEGAGSPAEVNLRSHDIVNMQMARYAGAAVLIVGDIDRGGVFASLVGTMEVMAQWERELVAGFLLNRFRGQVSLLKPALAYTSSYTGRPVLGVIPYLDNLGLPEEDSVSFKKGLFQQEKPVGESLEICLIDLPHISNFTDFEPFLREPDVYLRVIRQVDELKSPAALLLPGSKNVLRDLQYLRQTGLADRIIRLAATGCQIIGICGGLQMLGRRITDPLYIEAGNSMTALGLLPISTELAAEKTLQRRELVHRQSGLPVSGYEIHHGQSRSEAAAIFRQPAGESADPGASNGNIWGSYLHGIFDSDSFRHWFINDLRQRQGLPEFNGVRPLYDLEPAFDRLADTVRQAVNMDNIYRLLGL